MSGSNPICVKKNRAGNPVYEPCDKKAAKRTGTKVDTIKVGEGCYVGVLNHGTGVLRTGQGGSINPSRIFSMRVDCPRLANMENNKVGVSIYLSADGNDNATRSAGFDFFKFLGVKRPS